MPAENQYPIKPQVAEEALLKFMRKNEVFGEAQDDELRREFIQYLNASNKNNKRAAEQVMPLIKHQVIKAFEGMKAESDRNEFSTLMHNFLEKSNHKQTEALDRVIAEAKKKTIKAPSVSQDYASRPKDKQYQGQKSREQERAHREQKRAREEQEQREQERAHREEQEQREKDRARRKEQEQKDQERKQFLESCIQELKEARYLKEPQNINYLASSMAEKIAAEPGVSVEAISAQINTIASFAFETKEERMAFLMKWEPDRKKGSAIFNEFLELYLHEVQDSRSFGDEKRIAFVAHKVAKDIAKTPITFTYKIDVLNAIANVAFDTKEERMVFLIEHCPDYTYRLLGEFLEPHLKDKKGSALAANKIAERVTQTNIDTKSKSEVINKIAQIAFDVKEREQFLIRHEPDIPKVIELVMKDQIKNERLKELSKFIVDNNLSEHIRTYEPPSNFGKLYPDQMLALCKSDLANMSDNRPKLPMEVKAQAYYAKALITSPYYRKEQHFISFVVEDIKKIIAANGSPEEVASMYDICNYSKYIRDDFSDAHRAVIKMSIMEKSGALEAERRTSASQSLAKYFNLQKEKMEGKLDESLKEKMKKDVIKILTPLAKNNIELRQFKKAAGTIVRSGIEKAGGKLDLTQKFWKFINESTVKEPGLSDIINTMKDNFIGKIPMGTHASSSLSKKIDKQTHR